MHTLKPELAAPACSPCLPSLTTQLPACPPCLPSLPAQLPACSGLPLPAADLEAHVCWVPHKEPGCSSQQ